MSEQTNMHREWIIQDYDGFEGLSLRPCEAGRPGPTEVRMRIEAFALNWGDADLMRNRYSFSFTSFPTRVGMEAAGIVEEVGADVTGIKVGDRYSTLPHFYDTRGASADTLIIDQAYITKSPEGLSAVEAASVWMQYMTAYFPMIELAKAAPGRHIFIPAGTSTAGNAAIQIARAQGANVISTTRSESNRAYLTESGADHVFVDDGGDVAKFLLDVTDGVGAHASFDPVGGEFMERYAMSMSTNGHIYLYGLLSGDFADIPLVALFQRNLWFKAYSLFNYVEDQDSCARGTAFVYDQLAKGSLKPKVDKVFPMEAYIDAWHYLRGARESYGKVVIETGA